MKNKIIRDGHIHSPFCPHGTKDGFELYIKKALDKGLSEISFTEHMQLPGMFMEPELLKSCSPTEEVVDAYIKELKGVKEKYKGLLKINTGLEVDYVEGYEDKIREGLNRLGPNLQDGLLSVHFVKYGEKYYTVDWLEGFTNLVNALGSVEKVYDLYFNTLLKAIRADLGVYKPKRIGHPTLVRIFNKKYPLEYKNFELMDKVVREMKLKNYQIDFNTAGLRKPYCGETYPAGKFLELINKYGVEVVYGSDAHNSEDVGRDFAV